MQPGGGVEAGYTRSGLRGRPPMRTHELVVIHCHGGPPDGRLARTLYDLLGASPSDDAEGLKDAFRKAVKANHPDLHRNDPGATVRLSGIVRAYAILRDADERASYDQALAFERDASRPQPKRTFQRTMHHVLAEARAVAILAVVLGGGYVVVASGLSRFSADDRPAQLRGSTKVVDAMPQSGGAARSSPIAQQASPKELEDVQVTRPVIARVDPVAQPVASLPEAPTIEGSGVATSAIAQQASPEEREDVQVTAPVIARVEPAAQTMANSPDAPAIEESGVATSAIAHQASPKEPEDVQLTAPVIARVAAAAQPMASSPVAGAVEGLGAATSAVVAKTATTDHHESNQEVEGPDRDQESKRAADAGPPVRVEPSVPKEPIAISQSPSVESDPRDRRQAAGSRSSAAKDHEITTHEKRRAAVIRTSPSRPSVRQASLENKSDQSCAETQSCSGKSPVLLGIGF